MKRAQLQHCVSKPRSGANSQSASSEIGTIDTGKLPTNEPNYVGRFAPSPTGPLHFGSLVAAAASYLQARVQQGRWLVRVEDIDPPREKPGATDSILAMLEAYGFAWDGPVHYQSDSQANHKTAIKQLLAAGHAYHCGCSRRDLAGAATGKSGPIYPGTCRSGTDAVKTALRVRTDNSEIRYEDRIQGKQSHQLEMEAGDFVVLRKDGLVAYQLAVVVDDHLQGVTEVVRGLDLMESTPRQIWLQRLLGYETPGYAHIPLAIDEAGRKLSKSQGAAAVTMKNASNTLHSALNFLGQNPPPPLRGAPLTELWDWAVGHWNISVLTGVKQCSISKKLDQTPNSNVVKNP